MKEPTCLAVIDILSYRPNNHTTSDALFTLNKVLEFKFTICFFFHTVVCGYVNNEVLFRMKYMWMERVHAQRRPQTYTLTQVCIHREAIFLVFS